MVLLSIWNVSRLLHSFGPDFAFSLIMLRFCSPLHLPVSACPYGFIILHQPFAPWCCQQCLMGTLPLHFKHVPKRDHGPKYNHHFTAMIIASTWFEPTRAPTKMQYIHNPYNKPLTSNSDGSRNAAKHNVMLSAFFTEESKSDVEHSLLLFTG